MPSKISRRDFSKIAVAGLPLAALGAKIDPVVNGVHIGIQTYCFRDFQPSVRELPPGDSRYEQMLDSVLQAMTSLGVGECELWSPQVAHGAMAGMLISISTGGEYRRGDAEAFKKQWEAGREWHLRTPLEHFKRVRQKFDQAGIAITGYNCGWFGSPEEIDRTFEQVKAIGAKYITLSGTMSLAKKLAPYADRHKVIVAMHPHSNTRDPEQFATPESLTAPLEMSDYIWINLDIGHFTAGGYDAIDFIEKHHKRITNLHIKDRAKNQGPNKPWGEGDTPIRDVLQLLKRRKYPIPAYVELEYPIPADSTSLAETRKCLDFMRAALA